MKTKLKVAVYSPEDQIPYLAKLTSEYNGLDEWVDFIPIKQANEIEKGPALLVQADQIRFPIDRSDATPPYMMPDLPFSDALFLTAVLVRLTRTEEAFKFVDGDLSLSRHLTVLSYFLSGDEMPAFLLDYVRQPRLYRGNEAYKAAHNFAICLHYNHTEVKYTIEDIGVFYEGAMNLAPNENDKSFTLKHYVVFLTDTGQIQKAEALLRKAIETDLSPIARHDVQHSLAQVLLYKLSTNYDSFTLGELRSLLKDVLEYKRHLGNKIKEAMCLIDVSQAALMAQSYSEALGFVNKAVQIFQEEDFREFYGEALRRKGLLLYTWAKAGNPQFFKSALESFQKALEVFPKETAPGVYADIHHYLALIYAELPVEDNKKSLMAGLSVASFRKALEFFTKEEYPYEYAAICNHFGNALCHFPPAVHSDHFQKALHYYKEALEIRTKRFPTERALTLLNYLEAAWGLQEKQNGSYQQRFQDMWDKAHEILDLVKDESILHEARKHIKALKKLKSALENK